MINTKQQTTHKLENNLFSLGTKQFETKMHIARLAVYLFSRWFVPYISGTVFFQYLVFSVSGMNKVLVLPWLVMKTDNGTVLIKIKVSHSCNTYLIFLWLIIAISFTLKIKEKLKQLLLSP